jgi:ABC-type cobalamin/Fe3+-siderophores transport system ATPase subunit
MTLEERRKTVSIIDTHNGMLSIELCKELHKERNIAYKDQQSIRVCHDLTKAYSIAERAAVKEAPEVTTSYTSPSDVNSGPSSSCMRHSKAQAYHSLSI